MSIRAVFFDLGGTLLVMRRDRIISRILSDNEYPVRSEQVHAAYFKVEPSWLAIYGEKAMSGDETAEAYRQLDVMIFQHLFPSESTDEAKRISSIMRKKWAEVEKTVPLELYPDVAPTLSRLNADGFKLGLVSNAPPDTVHVIDSLGLPRYLPVIVVSGVVGYSKPNPEIFKIALRAAGAEAEETIHVGDIYEADVVGARKAGIQGVLIDREGIQAGIECPKIANLAEIYKFLAQKSKTD